MSFNDKCINCFGPTGGEAICMNCGYDQEIPDEHLSYLPPHIVLANRYEVGRVLNVTRDNVFYKAWDRVLSNVVCIKEYFPEASNMVSRVVGERDVDLLDPSRFVEWGENKAKKMEEIHISANISHDNAVHTVDVFEENNTVYHVMELLDGPSLFEYIRAVGKVSYEEMLDIIVPICDAVETMHKCGVIHGAINLGNIIITTDGDSKLLGICSEEKGNTIKTPFTSPEHDSGNVSDEKSDIYALAVVCYYILVGEAPSKTGSESKDIKAIEGKLKEIECPDFVMNALKKALSRKPSDRFSSVDEFKDYIVGNNKLVDSGISKKKIVLSIVAVCLVAVLAVGGAAFGYIRNIVTGLVPYRDADLTIWYEDTGDKELNKRFEEVAESYANDSRGNKVVADSITVTVDVKKKTKKQIEDALEKGEGPDIYVCSSDIDSKYAESLDDVYAEIEADDAEMTSEFALMKTTLSGNSKIAYCYDMPLLYVNTNNFMGKESPKSDVSLKTLSSGYVNDEYYTYKNSMVVNPEAVLYAAYSYGYVDGGKTTALNTLYKNAEKDGISHITESSSAGNMAKYYIGLASEYSSVENKIKLGNVVTLPLSGSEGGSYIFYPETWCVNKNSEEYNKDTKKDNKRAAIYMLYWLATNEEAQETLCKKSDKFHYIPLLKSACDNLVKPIDGSKIFAEKALSLSENYSEYQFKVDKADSIEELALKNVKTSAKKYKNAVKKEYKNTDSKEK